MALISIPEVKTGARAPVRLSSSFSEYYTKSAGTILQEQRRTTPVTATFDVFLSHSYTDAKLILDLKNFLEDFDLSVYVDWVQDEQLDRSKVTPATANQLRRRMNQCRSLLYATTDNSASSVWMPWELGYFDGRKGRAAIIPLTAKKEYGNVFKGQEYLGLYPYVVRQHSNTGTDMLWVHSDPEKYVAMAAWLRGTEPYKH